MFKWLVSLFTPKPKPKTYIGSEGREYYNDGRDCPICAHPGGECVDTKICPYWSQEGEDWMYEHWSPGQ